MPCPVHIELTELIGVEMYVLIEASVSDITLMTYSTYSMRRVKQGVYGSIAVIACEICKAYLKRL